MQSQQQNIAHVPSPAATPPRPLRLLYRRGLPDLPELIEAEEDEVTTADDTSMNSTRHSASTSASSREFPQSVAFAAGTAFHAPLSPKLALPSQSRQVHPPHDIYNQTPPGSVSQLQTPFEYIPSSSFRFNPQLREEASPPPSPSPREEALVTAGMGYGLGVNLANSENLGESGMIQEDHESGIGSGEYGNDGCLLEGCPECTAFQDSQRPSYLSYYQASESGGNTVESGDYMSPPSSPGTDCITESMNFANCVDADDQEAFYGMTSQSFPSLDRPRSPSLLLDSDAFSSVPSLPVFPPYSLKADDQSNDSGRSSRGLLGRKGTAVLNKVLPRSLRLKRWASTPSLPKLQITSPPPLPRMASTTILPSPTQTSRVSGTLVPPNTAFDYDPARYSDDEDEDEARRPTTRGTMMSREQLPTPPFLPTSSSTLPYIPMLDSPMSLAFPQSPSASVHNIATSSQGQIYCPPVVTPTIRSNSITSLSNQSMTSVSQIPSPTFISPPQRPSDIISPSMPPPAASILNMASLRGVTTPQHSPQLTHRPFPSSNVQLSDENKVEELLQQMELEDDAFAATEQRMATSGWSTETELGELRAKRQAVRRDWEERIEVARKRRRGSDGLSSHGSINASGEPSATPVITLQATTNPSNTPTLSATPHP